MGSRLALALALLATGCGSLKDRAAEYLSDAAVEQVTKAVDRKLEERGLSVAQLKTLADTDNSGDVDKAEVVALAKEAMKDYVVVTATAKSDEAKKEIGAKLASLADAADLDELREKAGEAGLFGKGTLGLLVSVIVGYLIKQVFSGKADARRDARLDFLEKLSGRDLDGDGFVGGGPPPPVVVAPAPMVPPPGGSVL